ncbi:hypothetical protein CcCBS67573_g07242 [Chytriomyces confervae]|uniref:Impact N-terminal domain-containing protein n=1 Tax=Chytriomyces confervae TaxID=246404 RepID=A0A507EYG2_9FUNG|nr:hypothetical protein CcCBS67573_g07242 [Chytriomyces confervae]
MLRKLALLRSAAARFKSTASSDGNPGKTTVSPLSIQSGPVVIEQRSKFQAHIARINSASDAARLVEHVRTLKTNKKATHFMQAYVLRNGACSDDGEKGAGDVMLRVLRATGQSDVAAVVVRWYGGVNMGGARFRAIGGVLKNLITNNPSHSDK